jgi:hypothetical protein
MFICPMFSILCQRQQPSDRPSGIAKKPGDRRRPKV